MHTSHAKSKLNFKHKAPIYMRTKLWLGATPHRLATDLQKNLKMNFTTATSKDRPHNKDKQHMPQLQCTD